MKAQYIDHMGTDLSVVNAARVSFSKTSEWEVEVFEDVYGQSWGTEEKLSEKDSKLIRYLARHNHWTPFGHTAITLHIKAPLFVARQLGKHQVGFVWNEVSRRYVNDEPEFYSPESWRKRPKDSIKQGSSGEFKSCDDEDYNGEVHGYFTAEDLYRLNEDIGVYCSEVYDQMLSEGVCPEQARMVLPQSMYTEWYWTGNLYGYANVYNLRTDPHSQKETQEVAKQIGDIIEPLFPVSWKELTQ